MYRCAQQPNKLCSSWHEKAFKSDSYLSQFFPLNIFNQLHFCFGGHRRYTCSMHPVSLRLHGPRLHRSGHYLWIESKFPITEMTDLNQLANVNWNVFLWQLYRSISVWPLSSWYENMIISQHVSFFKLFHFRICSDQLDRIGFDGCFRFTWWSSWWSWIKWNFHEPRIRVPSSRHRI